MHINERRKKGASRRPRSFNSFPLHHQQATQTRVVKGIGCDRHGPLPSLIPSLKQALWGDIKDNFQRTDLSSIDCNHTE